MSTLSNYLLRAREGAIEIFTNLLVNSRLFRRPHPSPDASLVGQTVLVTGCNQGIGKVVAQEVIRRGGRLIMVCRNTDSAQATADEIKKEHPSADIVIYTMDLSSLNSVRSCVEKIKQDKQKIDVIINNAGILIGSRSATEDGLETMIAVNYFGTILFTLLLFNVVKESSFGRILFVCSLAHLEVKRVHLEDLHWTKARSFPSFVVYGHSKLTLMLFLCKFAKKALNHGVRVYGVDPGIAKTELGRDWSGVNGFAFKARLTRPVFRSKKLSANSVIMPALFTQDTTYNPEEFYYVDGHSKSKSATIKEGDECDKLWEITRDTLSLEDIMDTF